MSTFERLVDRQGRPLSQIWPAVKQFQDVQDVLDRNRVLIAEINHNHQLGTNVALERNVPMLRELNGNIAKAVQLYKEAADSFVSAFVGDDKDGASLQPVLQQQAHVQMLSAHQGAAAGAALQHQPLQPETSGHPQLQQMSSQLPSQHQQQWQPTAGQQPHQHSTERQGVQSQPRPGS